MSDSNPTPQPTPQDDLAPLDDFEQQWVDQLAQREPDLVQSEEAFVQAVMQQAEVASAAGSIPTIIGRIGTAALPYAIAAALLLAAFVGWVVLTGDTTQTPGQPPIVHQPNDPTQPIDGSSVVTNVRPKIELGKLIANVQSTATSPANTLIATVSEVPQTLSIDRLFDLLGDSVPDLQEILAPLKPNDEQSRA